MQRIKTLKELENEDQETERDIPEKEEVVNINSLHRVADNELCIVRFALTEDKEKSITNIINDCENRE
jgi:hypothetical protein